MSTETSLTEDDIKLLIATIADLDPAFAAYFKLGVILGAAIDKVKRNLEKAPDVEKQC